MLFAGQFPTTTPKWLFYFFSLLGAIVGSAATVDLIPAADTTLIENSPNNNMGEEFYVNAGTTRVGKRNHGLFKFDIAAAIPAGARIRTAQVTFQIIYIQQEPPTATDYELRRVLRDWGEGDKISLGLPGAGDPASLGEATWNSPSALTTNIWSTPGGAIGVDFSTNVTATCAIYDSADSPYSFTSTTVANDVQFWLAHPDLNWGWVLKPVDESITFTAHRFCSSEDRDRAPMLHIDFLAPPVISDTQISANQMHFSFLAEAGQNYIVQAAGALPSTNWATVVTVPASGAETNVSVTQPLSPGQRFYRVIAP